MAKSFPSGGHQIPPCRCRRWETQATLPRAKRRPYADQFDRGRACLYGYVKTGTSVRHTERLTLKSKPIDLAPTAPPGIYRCAAIRFLFRLFFLAQEGRDEQGHSYDQHGYLFHVLASGIQLRL
jgi:hypothetical protein